MRARIRVVIISGVCLTWVLCLTLLFRPDHEPQYHGRSLRYWVLASEPPTDSDEAAEAIAQIGTNALPHLLQWIRHKPSAARAKLVRAVPPSLEFAARPLAVTRSDVLASASADAFRFLGTNATVAIPELITLMRQTNAGAIAVRAMTALSRIGTNGLPPLIAAAQDRQYPYRLLAVAIIVFDVNRAEASEMTAPILIGLLSDRTNPQIAPLAALGLGRVTNAPAMTLPPLLNCLTAANVSVELRTGAATSLGELGAPAASALPALSNALTDTNFTIRFAATNAIRRIHDQLRSRAAGS